MRPSEPERNAPGTGVRDSDVLRWPVVGPFLRWRHARTALQVLALLTAAAVVAHGLAGPQLAPANLATVVTWVHYRGLLVVALLAAGNLFCTACPFVLVRDAARRAHAPARRWPRRLRTKWTAIVLLVGVLFTYELFDLWALPRATAWLVLAYFAAALAIDVLFKGATFCKYLCPIGQFNFVTSTLSPLELRVVRGDTCRSCRTSDCIRGRRDADRPQAVVQRGCELALFLPSKVGNLDCTLCLDCVHACPHDNIALAPRVPGAELADDRRRSGIGRLAARPDLAALTAVFAFAALLNAFAMVGPAHDLQRRTAAAIGTTSEAAALGALFLAGLVVLPALLVGGAAALSRLAEAHPRPTLTATAVRYAYALAPIGVGVWAAHYGFHLLTGLLTVVPVAQSAVIDLAGRPLLGEPWWGWVGVRPGLVFPFQIGAAGLGALGSIAVAWAIAAQRPGARPLAAAAPWGLLIVALAAASWWVFSLPMDMRGTRFGG
jgi:hypothetical protein